MNNKSNLQLDPLAYQFEDDSSDKQPQQQQPLPQADSRSIQFKESSSNANCLKILIKYIQFLKQKGDQEMPVLLLMQERLIYTASYLLEQGIDMSNLHFDFNKEVEEYVQKVNCKVMEGGPTSRFEDLISLISKPIDMLLYKPVYKYIRPLNQVLDLRVLCFNNLSCIYRQQKLYHDAIKAVDKAILMEEKLVKENYGESMKNIASTFINKAVILSELGLHLESIETIKQSLSSMERYQKFHENQIEEQEAFQLKYLSVIAYFNLAVEHEHLLYFQYAKTFYEIALQVSKQLGYTEMIQNIEAVLKKVKKVN